MIYQTFKFKRLITYILLATALLIFSAVFSSYVQQLFHLSLKMKQLMSGLIFGIGALLALLIINFKNKNIITEIGLWKIKNIKLFLSAISIPVILLVLLFFISGITGVYYDLHINFNNMIWQDFLFNIVFAFLYEAFPEEVFIRGLILNELKYKFSFLTTLLLQPICFVVIACLAKFLTSLFLGEIEQVSVSYIIIIFVFGITLQLFREYAQSLWANITFHLIYLEMVRNVLPGDQHSLIIFQEQWTGFMLITGLATLYFGSIIILSLLLWRRNKSLN